MGTLIVILILTALIGSAIRSVIKDNRHNKGCGGCTHCPYSTTCEKSGE
ncbi:MAG: FeoB-associated Cys-rich membrane protein [Ruminococcus sp.]|nr:FeoB-associated Cys-rich membrane protein [Ruminococcus sp.]